MKKALLIGSLGVFGVIALASCKKDYTCECTSTSGSSSSTASTTINATKGDAKEACEAGSSSATSGGSTVTTTCEIK